MTTSFSLQRVADGRGSTPSRRRCGAVLVGVAFVLLSHRAAAETPPDVRAAAEKLYQDAYLLGQAGRHAEACKKLEESDRLDAATGTKVELAKCYEATNRPASAWALYLAAAEADRAAGKNKAREDASRARAEELFPTLPRLVIVVPEGAARAPGLAIERDGVPVGEGLWGTAIPVDPGLHAIHARAPGKRPLEGTARAAPGEITTWVLPALAEVAKPAPRSALGGTRTASLAVGGVGIAALAAGGVLGGLAIEQWAATKNSAQSRCEDPAGLSRCTPEVAAMGARAEMYATGSTVGFVFGGAALAGAAVLWLWPVKPGPRSAARIEILPSLGPTGSGALIRGSF